MKVGSVFVAGGQPSITYNPRTNLNIEANLTNYLDDGCKLISITGPTKSGKTVLCTKLIPRSERVLLSGGTIVSFEDFCNQILAELGESLQTTLASTTKTDTKGGELLGEASACIVKGQIKGVISEATSCTTTYTQAPIISLSKFAMEKLLRSQKKLIIDDFHYISSEVQTQIIRALKSPIFEGLRVVVLAVPHRAYDALKVETEMTGRVIQLSIPPWSQEDLNQIAVKGFQALNLRCSSKIIQTLAKESFASPNLMQEFCLRLCRANNIQEKALSEIELKLRDSRSFFESITDEVTSKVAYEKLAKGPRQRKDRIIRTLKDGTTVDIYAVTLRTIAQTGPCQKISYEELRSALKKIMDNPPRGAEIVRVLEKMNTIARSIEGEPVLDWSRDENNLFISDPYFAFYLKWAIKKQS